MTVVTFDTLKFSQRLREAGLDERAAQGITVAVADAVGERNADLATKGDVESAVSRLRAELKADNAALRAEFKADLAELRSEVKDDIKQLQIEMHAMFANQLRWVIGVFFASIGALFMLLRAFPPG